MNTTARGARSLPARLGLGLLVLLLLLAVFACDIFPSTRVSFDVQRIDPQVFTGASVGSMTALTSSTAQPLPNGHRVSTDSAGQALLTGQLSNNSTCHIYVFQTTTLLMKACPKSNYQGSNTQTCQEENTAAYRDCKGNVQMTPSGEVEVIGSWFSITYLPELQLTLVVVADGTAEVRPVIKFEEGVLGAPIKVEAQQFLYTAPDDRLRRIEGLPPRTPLPIEELPPLIRRLEIEPGMERAFDQARRDGRPFRTDSRDVPAQRQFFIRGQGGAMEDSSVQQAIVGAVDWTAILNDRFPNEEVTAILEFPGFATTTDQVEFDPRRSRALLAEAGYPEGLGIYGLVAEQDGELVDIAERMGDYLSEIGLEVRYRVEPAEEIPALLRRTTAAGEPLLWLAWE